MVLEYTTSYLAVLVSAVVGFVVSFIWWGPLFGKKWASLNGLKPGKMSNKGMGSKMIIALISQFVMAWVLGVMILSTGASTLNAMLTLTFFLWFGFVATIGVGIVLWNNKPWSLFWLNSIGQLVTLLIMAATLSFWY